MRAIVNGGRGWAVAVSLVLLVSAAGTSAATPAEELRAAERRLQQARREAARAAERLDEIRTDAAIAVERYNEASVRLAEFRSRLTAVQARFQRVQARMVARQGKAGDFARRLYQRGSAFELEALLGAASPAEVQARAVYLYSAAQAELAAVAALKNDRRVYAVRLDQLQRAHADVAAMERRLGAERAAVEGLFRFQAREVAGLERVAAAAEDDRDQAARAERQRAQRELQARERAARDARERAARLARERAERLAARQLEAASAGAHNDVPLPRGSQSAAPPAGRAPPASAGEAAGVAVEAAKSQIGKPYQWGAAGPDSYDCSGLTQWAWGQAGVYLPHSSRMQYSATRRIGRAEVEPGDLLFFGSPIHHVGIYIGNGEMVDAPYTGSHVGVRPAWRDDLAGIGRPGS